jgi:tetratricopeptide (TPR) repeat protein
MKLKEISVSNNVLFLTLAILSIILFFPFPKAGFILDAHYVVEENILIKYPQRILEVFKTDMFSTYRLQQDLPINYFRPLVLVSLALDYMVWGENPFFFRLTNLILHFLNSILVFYLIWHLFRFRKLAILTSLFFLILPIQEWVVGYIVGRGDLLQTFFTLWMMLFFVFSLEKSTIGFRLISSYLFFICALFSREVAVLNPLFIIAITLLYSQKPGKILRVCWPFFTLSAVYLVGRLYFLPIMSMDSTSLLSISGILHTFGVMCEYIYRFFVPWSLLNYMSEFYRSALFIGGVFLFSTILIVWHLKKKADRSINEVFLFALFWIFFSLISLHATHEVRVHLGNYLSEHFLYFASIGFSLFLSGLLLQINSVFLRQCLLSLIIPFYLFITFSNHLDWTSEKNILTKVHSLEKEEFTVAHQQLLMRYQKDEQKVLELIQTLDKDSKKSIWFKRLAEIAREDGNVEQAIIYLNQAVQYNPQNVSVKNLLAVCYFEKKEIKKGTELLEESLELDGAYFETYFIYGQWQYFNGKFETARFYLEKAMYYHPDFLDIKMYLLVTYHFLREKEEYLRFLSEISKDAKTHKQVRQFLQNEFTKQEQPYVPKLMEEFDKIIEKYGEGKK